MVPNGLMLMPIDNPHNLLIMMTILMGTGVFLRLVGKEKHRREKYLKQRLEDKINELKKQAEQQAEQAAASRDKVLVGKPANE